MSAIDYETGERVYVAQRGTDGPSGSATVTGTGLDGIGCPIATVLLDEYVTSTMGRMAGRDASGRSWREWTVQTSQLRLLERAA